MQEIESRILLSASPLGLDAVDQDPVDVDAAFIEDSVDPHTDLFMERLDEFTQFLEQQSSEELLSSVGHGDGFLEAGEPDSIVFLDQRLPDSETLLNQFSFDSKTTLFVTLDASVDGISQITKFLSDSSYQFKSITLLSHGSSGQLQLGSTVLNGSNLAEYQDQISSWQQGTTQQADLFIYGCQVANGNQGESFLTNLAQDSGLDISASDDLTGSAILGGDWDLEFSIGSIETSVMLNPDPQGSWNHVMATIDLGASKDTNIYSGSWSSNNYGASEWIEIDSGGGDLGDGRMLFQFDLSSIPSGATITSATLKLYSQQDEGGSISMNVYRVTESWTEGTNDHSAGRSNWDYRTSTQLWSTAGGTVDSNIYATLVSDGNTGWDHWDITTLAQQWHDGTHTNYGMMLASPSSGDYEVEYKTRESTTNKPILTIEYTLPNQAPVLTNPTTVTVDEDTQTAISGISFVDPDAGSGTMGARVIVNNGTLNFTLSGGASFLNGINNSDNKRPVFY